MENHKVKKRIVRKDCRKFLGEKPCFPFRECSEDCEYFKPQGTRILIVKFAAGGDVLRTVSLLEGLKKQYPISHITWVTEGINFPLLQYHPLIDRLFPFDFAVTLITTTEHYDIAINLEKIPSALALMENVKAEKKYGFGMYENGNLRSITDDALYAYWLGLSDQMKFNENQKSYPEIIYEVCNLNYNNESYDLFLSTKQQNYASKLRDEMLGKKKFLIGLNTGSGSIFATKRWKINHWIELISLLNDKLNTSLVLLGGPEERERNVKIIKRSSTSIIDSGTENTLEKFISIIASLDCVITGDTLAMHIAIALKKPVIVLIGPTSSTEIDLFGLGVKLDANFACAPCYRHNCDIIPNCMDAISADKVADATIQLLDYHFVHPTEQKK